MLKTLEKYQSYNAPQLRLVILEKFKIFDEINACTGYQEPEACNFIKKETLTQVFSSEFGEISKNSFSYRKPLMAASDGCFLNTSC